MPIHRHLITADQQGGFTIIELLIATFIIGTVVTGLFGLFVLSLRASQEGERRIAGIALANERMEQVRNLPYEDIGTVGGAPPGPIEPSEPITRNSQTYQVSTDIRFIDDPFDGVASSEEASKWTIICHIPPGNPENEGTIVVGSSSIEDHIAHGDYEGECGSGGSGSVPSDGSNTDYKQVRIEVSWPSHYNIRPVLLISHFSPQGVEEGELGGTLSFQALNAAGNGVADATVTLFNNTVSPVIDITSSTDENGVLSLPGLPPANDSYVLSVNKAGYTSEQTYNETATFVPDADHAHLSMIDGLVTEKTFPIDLTASLNVKSQDISNGTLGGIAYSLRGSKLIGVDNNSDPVYMVDRNSITDGLGNSAEADLVWDSYTMSVDGETTGYDIKETSLLLPLIVNPDDVLVLLLTLVDHTPVSLHVTVTDSAGDPVTGASVHLTDNGVDETQVTSPFGQVFFADLASNGDFTITIDAGGFNALTQTVSIQDTSFARYSLISS